MLENWNEVRSAYMVASLGTVSAAAEALGVHRVTVIRHIDALEQALGEKLFQRHSRGYTPTEAGLDLMRVGKATEEQFGHLLRRANARTHDLTGELVVTSVLAAAPLLMPALGKFRRDNPGVLIRYLTSERVFKLEYGEAHVAIRAGAKPQELDNVVQPLTTLDVGLFASDAYLARMGIPATRSDLIEHDFIGSGTTEVPEPVVKWIQDLVPAENISLGTNSVGAVVEAVLQGIGIGFIPKQMGRRHANLVEVLPDEIGQRPPLWIVTHVDLHRTSKVQAFLDVLKATTADAAQDP